MRRLSYILLRNLVLESKIHAHTWMQWPRKSCTVTYIEIPCAQSRAIPPGFKTSFLVSCELRITEHHPAACKQVTLKRYLEKHPAVAGSSRSLSCPHSSCWLVPLAHPSPWGEAGRPCPCPEVRLRAGIPRATSLPLYFLHASQRAPHPTYRSHVLE